MYKKASKLKLRIFTKFGNLSVEQLWDLSLADLSAAIKVANKKIKQIKELDGLDFLEGTSKVDPIDQLSFDILKDIFLEKKKEADEIASAREVKEYNQKILSLIAKKQDESLESKSLEELTELLK